MGLFVDTYKKKMIIRYDKDEAIPYFSAKDFSGLDYQKETFKNTRDIEIAYFTYSFKDYKKDKVILFLPGMGPGHTAYLAEINSFCRKGYKVITLDYTGCGESKGETLISMNEPTRDVVDLLNHLKLKEEIIIVGHSVGAYTALNVIHLREEIKKGVCISGFLNLKDELMNTMITSIVVSPIMKYEKSVEPDYFDIDNVQYLSNTEDKILFIHSKDDNRVKFVPVMHVLEKLKNPNLTLMQVNHKKHNPTYTEKAVEYLDYCFKSYEKLLKKNASLEERKKFMKDKSIYKMTEQDKDMIQAIINYIEK